MTFKVVEQMDRREAFKKAILEEIEFIKAEQNERLAFIAGISPRALPLLTGGCKVVGMGMRAKFGIQG